MNLPFPFGDPSQKIDGTMSHTKIFIYPCYIDSKVEKFYGRKIPKEFCVENPFIEEVSKAISDLKLEGIFTIQKRHPRNFWKYGRASVDFFKIDPETGEKTPLHPQYPTRKDLLKAIVVQIKYNREHLPPIDPKKIKMKGIPKRKL